MQVAQDTRVTRQTLSDSIEFISKLIYLYIYLSIYLTRGNVMS